VFRVRVHAHIDGREPGTFSKLEFKTRSSQPKKVVIPTREQSEARRNLLFPYFLILKLRNSPQNLLA
jgi:hypothetical protein